jgi:Fur family transcriptional regulator, zinc uptake regulator
LVLRRQVAKTLQIAETICRRTGARLTPQRRMVLETVLTAKTPLTAYEVLDRLRKQDDSATPASVYRTLEFLIAQGFVHRIDSTKTFVACSMPDHEHSNQLLVCRECGTAIEAEDHDLADAAEQLSRRLGFSLDRKTVELVGICATCKH